MKMMMNGVILKYIHSKECQNVPIVDHSGSLKSHDSYGDLSAANNANNIITTASDTARTIRVLFLFCFLSAANCSLITSSFSAITFKSFSFFSAISTPRMSLTGVSNSSEILISISASGTDRPDSHFETVCLTTCNLRLNSSWDNPLFFLNVFKLSFNIFISFLCQSIAGMAVATSTLF